MNFYLLSPGSNNPLLDPDLQSGLSIADLWIPTIIVTILLAHTAYTDLFQGRRISNMVSLAVFLISLAISPLLYANLAIHLLIAVGIIAFLVVFYFIGAMAEGDIKLYFGLAILLGAATVPLLFISWLLIIIYSLPIMINTYKARKNKKKDATDKFGQRLGAGPGAPGIAMAFPLTLWAMGLGSKEVTGLLLIQLLAVVVFYFNNKVEERFSTINNKSDKKNKSTDDK